MTDIINLLFDEHGFIVGAESHGEDAVSVLNELTETMNKAIENKQIKLRCSQYIKTNNGDSLL